MLNKLVLLVLLALVGVAVYYAIDNTGSSDNELTATNSSSVNETANNKHNIVIENFRVILPPEVSKITAAYGTIKNVGNKAVTLIGVRSEIAKMTELHESKKMESGYWGMEHVPSISIEPGAELILKPMSYHIMIMNLTSRLNRGDKVKIWFEFKNSGEVVAEVPILSSS